MHEHRRDGAELLALPAGEAAIGEIPNIPRLPVVVHRGALCTWICVRSRSSSGLWAKKQSCRHMRTAAAGA